MTSDEARECFGRRWSGRRRAIRSRARRWPAGGRDRPEYVEALEHLATLLITRRQRYAEGLEYVERAVARAAGRRGPLVSLGWCYEFAAHELRRGGDPLAGLETATLYERAAEAFQRCLALHPEGKLVGDAEDLLDHVENELRSL